MYILIYTDIKYMWVFGFDCLHVCASYLLDLELETVVICPVYAGPLKEQSEPLSHLSCL